MMIREEFKKIHSPASLEALVSRFGLKELRSARRSPSVLDEWTGAYEDSAIFMKHFLGQADNSAMPTVHSVRLIISTSNGEVLTDDEVTFEVNGNR